MATVEEFLTQGSPEPFLLRQYSEESASTAPAVASRVYNLQKTTGLPEDVVSQNIDELERETTKSDFNAEQFRAQSPRVAAWMAKSQNAYATIKAEPDIFGKIEHTLNAAKLSWEAAHTQSELADIVGRYMETGQQTPVEVARMEKLQGDLSYAERVKNEGTANYIAGSMSSTITQASQVVLPTLKGTLTGASAGAAGGALVAGVGALPGAAAGAAAGASVAGYKYTEHLEGSMSFVELSGVKDIDGNPLPFDVRVDMARKIGAAAALIEVGGTATLGLLIPGVKQLSGKLLGKAESLAALKSKLVAEASKKSYARSAAKAVGTAVGVGAIEGTEEFAQAYVGVAGRELAQADSPQAFVDDGWESDFDSALSQSKSAFVGSALTFGLLGGGATFAADMRSISKAKSNAQMYTELGKSMEGSTTDKTVAEDVVASIVAGGPNENVHVDAAVWTEYWTGQGIDPREAAKAVIINMDEYDASVAGDSSLTIPMSKYAAHLSGTPHGEFFVNELRDAPDVMNSREALSAEAAIEAQLQASVNDPEVSVATTMAARLESVGYTPEEAESSALQMSAVFATMGGRAGVSPQALFGQYGVAISGPSDPIAPEDFTAALADEHVVQSQSHVAEELPDSPRWKQMQEDVLRGTTLLQSRKSNIGSIPITRPGEEQLESERVFEEEGVSSSSVEDLKKKLSEAGIELFQSAKGKRIGASGTAEQWVQRYEKTVDWNTILPLGKNALHALTEYVRGAVDASLTPEAIEALTVTGLKDYIEGLVNAPHADPQVQQAVAVYRQDPVGALETIQGQTADSRRELLYEWRDYLTIDNPVYAEDPFFTQFVWEGVVGGLSSTRPSLPPTLDRAALALVYDTIQNNPGNSSFSTLYSRAVTRLVEEQLSTKQVLETEEGSRWIHIPKTSKGSKDFQQNTLQLRALSCSSWCTSSGMEKTYLPRGDFYIMQKGGVTKMAVRMEGEEVAEIQGPANDGNIPQEHFADVEALTSSGKFKLSRNAKGALDTARLEAADIARIAALSDAGLADELGIVLLEDGTYNVPVAPTGVWLAAAFKRLPISTTTFSTPLHINTSAPYLRSVAGAVTLGVGVSTPLLTSVEGGLIMRGGSSTPALRYVGGDTTMYDTASAPALTRVGGDLVLHEGAAAPALLYVGGGVTLRESNYVPLLAHVDGHVLLFPETAVPALVSVDGGLAMSVGASAPVLTRVGGSLNMPAGASAPVLISVGGSRNIHENAYAPLLNRTLYQDEVQPRGSITITPYRKATITLNTGKDLSTFLHESSHLYLELLRDFTDDAKFEALRAKLGVHDSDPGRREQMHADAATIASFVGAENLDNLTTEQHELFARAGEAYFREGVSPTPELQQLFARFQSWLKRIYRDVAQLDVTLTDEVRRVFDRLIASDVQMAAAQKEAPQVGKFATAEDAGLSKEEFDSYAKLLEAATAKAKAEMAKRVAREILNSNTRERREARKVALQQVDAKVQATRDYSAVAALRERPLSLELLKEYYPPTDDPSAPTGGVVAGLVRMGIAVDNSALDPDDVAAQLGYGSGDEMVRALTTLQPRAKVVKQEVDALMEEQFGAPLQTTQLKALAIEQLNGPDRSKVLELELSILQRLQRMSQPLRAEGTKTAKRVASAGATSIQDSRSREEVKAIRGMVVARIGRMLLKELHPAAFLAAARRAGAKATTLAGKQDWLGAIEQTRLELYNTELYREGLRVQRVAETTRKYALRLQERPSQERLGLAGGILNEDGTTTEDLGYQEQVNALLERFEFRRQTYKSAARKQSLRVWAESQKALNLPVNLPEGMLDETYRKPYREMTPEELAELREALQHIVHLSNLKNKLLKSQDRRNMDEIITELVASAQAGKRRKNISIETRKPQDAKRQFVQEFLSEQRKVSSLVRELDGFKSGGAWWRAFVQPLNAAAAKESQMQVEANKKLSALFKPLSGFKRLPFVKGAFREEFIPEINMSLTRVGRIVVALNMGNDGNRASLLTGYGWTQEQADAVMRPLTKAEWDFVQGVWDLLESFWPETSAMMRRVDGVAPGKVEAVPVVTRFGTYRGGYFRLKYDGRQSPRAQSFLVEDMVKAAMGGGAAREQTAHGHTEARVQGVNMPVRLDLGVIFEALSEVIHHQTHYEALIDTHRLLANGRVQQTLIKGYGNEVYTQFKNALRDVAAGSVPADTVTARAFVHARTGASIAGLGWSITSAAMQVIGITQSIQRVGGKWIAVGIKDFIGDAVKMESAANAVHAESTMMANRSTTMTRELYDLSREVTTPGVVPQDVKNSFFWLMTRMQMLVDIPTYLGARAKALQELGHDNAVDKVAQYAIYAQAVAQAEQAVLDAQGGGNLIDRSAFYRSPGFTQLFTLFGTYFNTLYNATAESVRRYRLAPASPAAIGHLITDFILLYFGPAMLTVLFKEAFTSDDDTDDRWEKVVKELASMGVSNLVGVREFSGLFSEYSGYSGPAGIRVFGAGIKAAGAVEGVLAEDKDISIKTFKVVNVAGGIVFHYPATQVNRVVEGLAYDIEKGELSRAPLVGVPR